MNINDIQQLSPDKVAELPPYQLAKVQQLVMTHLADAKQLKSWLDDALILKYHGQSQALRTKLGKDTGTIRFKDDDFEVVSELPKKVSWNQHTLKEISTHLISQHLDPTEFIDISYKVSERKYSEWSPEVRAQFKAARTINIGKQVFKLNPKEH